METIKEEKKADLEQLLNSLIERGWKVYGIYDKLMTSGQNRGKKVFGFGLLGGVEYSLRELVSKESGLWQFVCENGMVENAKKYYDERVNNTIIYPNDEYKYRLIESALKDESELEDFLLSNIKLDVKGD